MLGHSYIFNFKVKVKLIKEQLKNIALSIISITFFCILLEIGFRIYIKFATLYDMEMHKYAKKLKQESATPGLTHEHKPNSEAELMRVNVAINSSGFRDDFIPHKKEENEYQILVAGSSITMGWGVIYDSVFTSLLEKGLNDSGDGLNYEVINSGIGNYNTVMEAVYLEKILRVVNPDKVILHYFLNDVEYISNKNSNIFIEYSYLIAYLYVRLKQSILSSVSSYNSIGEYYSDMYKSTSKGWYDAQNSIIKINNLCKSKGIEFMVLIQPDLHNLSLESQQFYCHLIIRTFLENNNIVYLDLFNVFAVKFKDELKNLWVSNDDPHPNVLGHTIIYQALYEYIIEHWNPIKKLQNN